ncbi:lysozyme inhibitor LprI family protein [Rhizobium sp. ZPR3]|uniref:Lysozyme inhibitor LprI family protein n=2 Tax=unclassified Rhizobium TaxID=2613769 RepID=A0AAU7SND5_9HYPH
MLPCTQSFAAAPALCAEAPNQTAKTLCAAGKLKTAESALDQAYAALDARLEPLGKRNLKLAQEAWLKFRDLECNLETGSDPDRLGREGTIMSMLLGECAIALTEQRTRDLTEQLKCPGGDLSCEP